MKKLQVTVVQELQMKYDPILGTKYELVNVILQQNIPSNECKHNTYSMIHIGNRNYCTICQEWITTSNTKS